MTTGRLTLLIALVAAALSVVANAAAATPKLTGEVGPSFSIELKQGSKDVKTLKAERLHFGKVICVFSGARHGCIGLYLNRMSFVTCLLLGGRPPVC